MGKHTDIDIRRVAKNACIILTKEEEKEFMPQLKEVLDAFSKLQELKTECEPTFHPVTVETNLRKDKTGRCLSQEQALKNTRHKKDGYFKGPGV